MASTDRITVHSACQWADPDPRNRADRDRRDHGRRRDRVGRLGRSGRGIPTVRNMSRVLTPLNVMCRAIGARGPRSSGRARPGPARGRRSGSASARPCRGGRRRRARRPRWQAGAGRVGPTRRPSSADLGPGRMGRRRGSRQAGVRSSGSRRSSPASVRAGRPIEDRPRVGRRSSPRPSVEGRRSGSPQGDPGQPAEQDAAEDQFLGDRGQDDAGQDHDRGQARARGPGRMASSSGWTSRPQIRTARIITPKTQGASSG